MNESKKYLSQKTYEDDIDFRKLIGEVWAGKWLIIIVTLSATTLAIIFALAIPNIYRAEALLAPNDRETSGGLSALAAQYGGLASLAGINLGTGSSDKTALGLEVIKSRKFVSEFIERHDVLVPLMAAKKWDPDSGDLRIDADLYDTSNSTWVRKVAPPKKTVPSAQEAYKRFSEILYVSQNKKSGLVSIAVEHYSPSIAKQWVDWIVDDINSTFMRRDVAEAEQAITYLNTQIAATSLAELQGVFYRLIEEQTKTVMLAKVSPEYLFKTIDPAVAPELKARPKRSAIVILWMLIGFSAGVMLVFVRNRIIAGKR